MTALSRADLRDALDVVHDISSTHAAHPFPLPILERLGQLLGAQTVGYCETPRRIGHGSYELVTRPAPSWLHDELDRCGLEDPTHAVYLAEAEEPVAISDLLSWREFSYLDVYRRVCRRNGVADSLRVYLPGTAATARFFFFDKETYGFPRRGHELLSVLRPHLVLWRSRWGDRADDTVLRLTRREAEILEAVAGGATNAEIARRLWISPHTVRTHLEHVFEKLGVRTRTEAAARLRS